MPRAGTVQCHLYRWIAGAEPLLDGKRKKPLPDAQMHPWSVFSSKCPHSQEPSVLLRDVSFPGMPEDRVAQEDGRRHWIARTPTGWRRARPCRDTSQLQCRCPDWKDSPSFQGFQQCTGRYGRRQKGHFAGSVNKSFYLQLSLLLPP